jgi:hypothetical protein
MKANVESYRYINLLSVVVHGDTLTESECVNTNEPDFKTILLCMLNFWFGYGLEDTWFETW